MERHVKLKKTPETNDLDDFFRHLIDNMAYDREHGSLNYYFDIREGILPYLDQIKKSDFLTLKHLNYTEAKDYLETLDADDSYHLLLYLILVSYYSVKYIEHYLPKVQDPSLRAVLNVCFSREMIFDLEYSDPELDVLSDIFNNLSFSARKNLHCYDCGTTARGVFYNLIKANRGTFWLDGQEIFQIRKDYYKKTKNRFDGLRKLITNLRTVDRNCVFIVGLAFGPELFGHILVAEVVFINGKRIIRFYQSALNSFLLIDYLAKMRYLENEDLGINLKSFERDMTRLLSVPAWGDKENNLFVKWFSFWPQDQILDTRPILFHHAYITY